MNQKMVPFGEAVMNGITTNYCKFSGRASRSEFWWFMLFEMIVYAIVACLGSINQTFFNVLNGLVSLGFILPSLGLAVRRLHDINKSGWLVLLGLIPVVGTIILLIWYCKASDLTENQYGPVPNAE